MGSVPVVLLARKESSRAVYALERQENGLYVVFRLGSWVNLEELAKDASAVCHERLRPPVKLESQGPTASSAITTPQLHKDQNMKRAAIEAIQSLVRKRPRSQSVSTMAESERHDGRSDATVPMETKLPSPVLMKELVATPIDNTKQAVPSASINPEEPPPQQTADEIFDALRTQYFDALYKSMVRTLSFQPRSIANVSRARSLTLPKDHSLGLVLLSTSISSPAWTWET